MAGRHLNPSEHAIVLCAGEKSQIQARDRTPRSLPMSPRRRGIMKHDDRRHGTATLFAALNVTEGRVIGKRMQRHRHPDRIQILDPIDGGTPKDLDLHLIDAINGYIATHNDDPGALVRTAKAGDIPAQLRRARAPLDKTPSE